MSLSKSKKNTLLMVSSDFISSFGDTVFNLSMMWFIYEQTGSALSTVILGTLGHIASMFGGPVAGVMVDRNNPQNMLRNCLVISGFLLILMVLALLFFEGYLLIGTIYGVMFLLNTSYAFTHPSETKLIPHLVERDNISSLYGFRSSSSQISALIGNASSGFLLIWVGIIGSVMIHSVSFLIAAVLVSCMNVLRPFSYQDVDQGKTKNSFWRQIMEGLRVIKDNRVLRKITYITIFLNVASFIGPLYVVLVRNQYSGGAAEFGMLHAFGLVGGIIGGLCVKIFQKKLSFGLVMAGGWVLTGIMIMCLSQFNYIILAYMLYFGISFSLCLSSIMLTTVSTLVIPEQLRGRVSGIMQSLSILLIPVTNILGGIFTDLFEVSYMFLFAGVWIIMIGLYSLRSTDIVNAGKEKEFNNMTM